MIGLGEYLQDYFNEKVTSWVNEVAQLAEFARAKPQASFAASTFGLKQCLRALPDIQDFLEPLDEAISQVLIPSIVEHKCSKLDRDVPPLPMGLGGLRLGNSCHQGFFHHFFFISVFISLKFTWFLLSRAFCYQEPGNQKLAVTKSF